MVVIVLLESSSNLEKMLTSYSSQVIFFKILITSIIHQKKHKLCPHVLNIIRSTHTVWMEHIDFSYICDGCPAQAGEQGLGANGSKIPGVKDL